VADPGFCRELVRVKAKSKDSIPVALWDKVPKTEVKAF